MEYVTFAAKVASAIRARGGEVYFISGRSFFKIAMKPLRCLFHAILDKARDDFFTILTRTATHTI